MCILIKQEVQQYSNNKTSEKYRKAARDYKKHCNKPKQVLTQPKPVVKELFYYRFRLSKYLLRFVTMFFVITRRFTVFFACFVITVLLYFLLYKYAHCFVISSAINTIK